MRLSKIPSLTTICENKKCPIIISYQILSNSIFDIYFSGNFIVVYLLFSKYINLMHIYRLIKVNRTRNRPRANGD